MGAVGGMLGIHSVHRGRGHAPAIPGLDPELQSLFDQRFILNPWTEAVWRSPFGQLTSMAEQRVQRLLKRAAFHDAILRPQRIVDQSCFKIRQDALWGVCLPLMHRLHGHATRADTRLTHAPFGRHLPNAVELTTWPDTPRQRVVVAKRRSRDRRP
jgi:hypothetical protein